MRHILIRRDLNIPGYGFIPKGTEFEVIKYNQRFVYSRVSYGTILRLARKRDCIEEEEA